MSLDEVISKKIDQAAGINKANGVPSWEYIFTVTKKASESFGGSYLNSSSYGNTVTHQVKVPSQSHSHWLLWISAPAYLGVAFAPQRFKL